MDTPIVELQYFIQAIRDAGYRGTGSALAELVDNSFEADARSVEIEIKGGATTDDPRMILVRDEGHGMTPAVLRTALQFGGSNRFGQRRGTGRFGMGLPNSSVSQARRVEVFTWTAPKRTWWSYLDVDEIQDGKLSCIPEPRRRQLPMECGDDSTDSGTVVIWHKCDRLSLKRESSLVKRLRRELGRIFRMMLWDGRKLIINGETILPIDPLFLHDGENLKGAKMYGPEMVYDVKGDELRGASRSKILVRFAELPVKEWVGKSNCEKAAARISNGAGVSILRAGREIDFGWFFMGSKRKENYDDWWRCEVEFQPELDELFGVTHTKQGITPSEPLLQLLSPDFETVAHKLNARVRSAFIKVRERKVLPSERRAIECDRLFAPPRWPKRPVSLEASGIAKGMATAELAVGMRYKLAIEKLDAPDFYLGELRQWGLQLVLNEQHPFCERFYLPLTRARQCDTRSVSRALELLLFAAARAEGAFAKEGQGAAFANFRKQWSNMVAAFLA
jgi:hypothetical protein